MFASLCLTVCSSQAAFPGLGAIALDALTRREWIKEDELAEQLKVHPKVMRRVLRFLEQVCWLGKRMYVGLCVSAHDSQPLRQLKHGSCYKQELRL